MVKFVWNFQIFLQITEYNFIFQKFLGTSRFWSYKEVFLRLASNTRISRLLKISARQPKGHILLFTKFPHQRLLQLVWTYEKVNVLYLKISFTERPVKKIARG